MCGIVGIVGKRGVNQDHYDALTVLQHRGQDAAGMVTGHQGKLNQRKNSGLVRDVVHQRHMQRLVGHTGIGHVRYPAVGTTGPASATCSGWWATPASAMCAIPPSEPRGRLWLSPFTSTRPTASRWLSMAA